MTEIIIAAPKAAWEDEMKKRILSLALALTLAVLAFAAVGCSEIESSSRIERMIMTLEFYNAENEVVDVKDVQLKLYANFAPETVKAFKDLCESGFYDGVCVYNVQTNWLEFGKFSFDGDGNLVETEAYEKAEAIKGEFYKNGWKGNKLTASKGAIVMKRDYDDENVIAKKYDTAKGSIVITFGSVSTFSADKYCVFGMVCDDDDDRNPLSARTDSAVTDRSGMSSIEILSTVKNLRQNDDATITYYYDPVVVTEDMKFAPGVYTKAMDDDGVTHYYRGAEISEENVLVGEDSEAFINLLSEKSNYIYVVPYTKVIVKKIVKKQ